MQLMSRMMNKRKKATASGLDNPRVSEPARNRTFKEFLELCELIESSSGERMPRGSTGRRTGRALNQMKRDEKSTAAVSLFLPSSSFILFPDRCCWFFSCFWCIWIWNAPFCSGFC